MNDILWRPDKNDLTNSQMARFKDRVNATYHQNIKDYHALHTWSCRHKNDFWKSVWDFCQIKSATGISSAFKEGPTMRDAVWFENTTLNYAQNLLRRQDDHIAIRYKREDGLHHTITFKELNEAVYQLAAYLQSIGVKEHDRVAGFMTNCPQTVIAMLATTLLGAIWTSCSPDFGEDGVLDRFGQIQPKVLFAVNSHLYNGKVFHHDSLIKSIKKQIDSIETIIMCSPDAALPQLNAPLRVAQYAFDHPAFILYSSGTTGQPKCMVHGAGGTLIQHLKELQLHSDITQNDTLFFYSTCGWMMWNWLVSGLAIGATIVLYDGSPFTKNKSILYDLIDEMDITHFGAGAKYFESSSKFSLTPKTSHKLHQLRCILTTGSPLLPNTFDYIYTHIKKNLRVSSISGGSDIISCFALGNPILPVYRGQLQCIGLGMDVHVFNEQGNAVINEKGELVCTSAFVSRPIYFWNDQDGEKYRQAYFNRYPGIWTHGDYALLTRQHGLIIYGRSDTTLNPRGVRIGTAEIYRQVEKIPEILESVAVGRQEADGEVIVLLVVLQPGLMLDTSTINMIKHHIKHNTSPLHVPRDIIQVPDFPRTYSGKTIEMALKKLINGQTITNTSAMANPDILKTLEAILQRVYT